MSVQARFYVRQVNKMATSVSQAHHAGWAAPAPLIQVHLSPVSGSKGDHNKEWSSATPSGSVELTIGNPDAAKWFEERLGQDIAITFEDRPADE